MRYRFYREHKYVSAALNDLERLIAQSDFRDARAIAEVQESFNSLAEMLTAHAEYENEKLHSLLKGKSQCYTHAEEDHENQAKDLEKIRRLIQNLSEDPIEGGYTLYLTYRKFVADNLLHLHEEETQILPELQRLYTDEELRQVEAKTYAIMTPDQMIHMMRVIFPYMNPSDREAFLTDIRDCEPEKFAQITPILEEHEYDIICR